MLRRYLVLSGLVLVLLTQAMIGSINSDDKELKSYVLEKVEARRSQMIEVSDAIWDYAEIALLEFKSSKLLADIAEKEGFEVERGVADLETAFVAVYGSGKPIIGILAEYDALPGLSKDGAGHGCGHNLFGAGSLSAALVLKDLIKEGKLTGTLKLYGCPAEEDVGGKLYMAREGLFDDLDACLAWHPSYETSVDVTGSQAIDDLYIEFFGNTSHAAFDPWQGRSALDALEMSTFAPFEIPWHSWAVVKSSKHSVGYKGMLLAVKVLAATAVDLFEAPKIIAEMKKEFDNSRSGYVYTSGIPKDKKPPIRIK